MFFAMCHKVKFIEATKHFRPLFEDDASRKRKLPTSHSCPADLAVSDPELPLRTETKTRMQTEASSSSHGTSDTSAAEKSKLELELEDAVEKGFELRKGLGLRFQRAHAPNTAKHAEYKALKSHQQKAQFRRDWANQELRNLQQQKTHCQSYQDVDRELGEYVCFAAMVEKFGHSYDPTGATQRANVYAGKCDKMGGSWVSWNAMINEKEYFYLRRQHETVFAEKWPLFSAESQDCELLDEEPADDRRPQRDAQQTLENATPAKNKSKAKATYTQCFPQHTRVLHMHVAVLHGPRVCLCRFWVDPKPRQRPRSLQRSKETTTGQLA